MHVRIDANPVPASRPRLSRYGGGVFYTKGYADFYSECQRQLRDLKTEAADGPIVVALRFLMEKPRTSKLWTPRADVDNLAKGPLDAVTKVERIWKDDKQITDLFVRKRWAVPGEPCGVDIHYTIM